MLLDVYHCLVPSFKVARTELALLDWHLEEGVELDAVCVRTVTARRLKHGVELLRERRSLVLVAVTVVQAVN